MVLSIKKPAGSQPSGSQGAKIPPGDDSPLDLIGDFIEVKKKFPKQFRRIIFCNAIAKPIPSNYHIVLANLRVKIKKIFTPKVTPQKTSGLKVLSISQY